MPAFGEHLVEGSIVSEELTCEPCVPSASSSLICCALTLCDQLKKLGREGLRESHRVSHFSCHIASVSQFQNLKISSHTKQCLPFNLRHCNSRFGDRGTTPLCLLPIVSQVFQGEAGVTILCQLRSQSAAACSTKSANASASF